MKLSKEQIRVLSAKGGVCVLKGAMPHAFFWRVAIQARRPRLDTIYKLKSLGLLETVEHDWKSERLVPSAKGREAIT